LQCVQVNVRLLHTFELAAHTRGAMTEAVGRGQRLVDVVESISVKGYERFVLESVDCH
jgi:hypothetical protein